MVTICNKNKDVMNYACSGAAIPDRPHDVIKWEQCYLTLNYQAYLSNCMYSHILSWTTTK